MRYILYILGIFVVMIAVIVSYLSFFLPNVGPAPDITIELTEERVQRGEYLANYVMLCTDCHAVRDFNQFAGPLKPGTLGAGGELFDRENVGIPGSMVAPNLTPAALADWTDGEIFRAITSGVSKDGSALFPIMPYPNYSQLDKEDIYAVIAYLRTLEPVEFERPPSEYDFPVNLLINTMPMKPNMQTKPPKSDVINYGRYLVTAAACNDCHTRIERGEFVGEPFAGGNTFVMQGGGVVTSANITPHQTGIGNWTKEQFVTRFKMYADTSYVPHEVKPGQFQTIMPWIMYGGMDEEDLGAIYEYLRTLEPVDNLVEIFTPAR
ncbi:MAG: cytochrome C [Balneolaceae bacterium]|nr:cytochrome C [Balneolaceae bacterium]